MARKELPSWRPSRNTGFSRRPGARAAATSYILKALKQALAALDLPPTRCSCARASARRPRPRTTCAATASTGCTAGPCRRPRARPWPTPSSRSSPRSGDGCSYGEGGNHFLAAIRRNVTMAYLVHDNQIYGLTKGQASPTTPQGRTTKFQPQGQRLSAPFNPLAVAVAMGAPFVARGYCRRAPTTWPT